MTEKLITIVPKEIPAALKSLDAMLAVVRNAKTYKEAARVIREAEAIKAIFKEIDAVRLRAGKVIVLANHRIGLELTKLPVAKGGQPYQRRSTGNTKLPEDAATLAELAGYKMRGHRLKKLAAYDPDPRAEIITEITDSMIRDAIENISVGAVLKFLAAEETMERRKRSRTALPLADGMEFRKGDCRVVLADIPDDSIPLILTDPPYGDDAEPLYEWLASWAARVLIPGGSLICYTGQSRLDRDMAIFSAQLRYWWLLIMPHKQPQRLPGKFVSAGYKPVLWYVKDHRRGRSLIKDVLDQSKRDKEVHDWGQGEAGVSQIIEGLTDPGELILDPFAGSCLWGEISAAMGRRWIGSDVENRGDTVIAAE